MAYPSKAFRRRNSGFLAWPSGSKLRAVPHVRLQVPSVNPLKDLDQLDDAVLHESLAQGAGLLIPDIVRMTFAGDNGKDCFGPEHSGSIWAIPLANSVHPLPVPFCPSCLSTDSTPYYRKNWRYGFHPICPKHGLLSCTCPTCGHRYAYISYDRTGTYLKSGPTAYCPGCGNKFGTSLVASPDEKLLEAAVAAQAKLAAAVVEGAVASLGHAQASGHSLQYLKIFRWLISLLGNPEWGSLIAGWIAQEAGLPAPPWAKAWEVPLELQTAETRAWMIVLITWLADEWPLRFTGMATSLRLKQMNKPSFGYLLPAGGRAFRN